MLLASSVAVGVLGILGIAVKALPEIKTRRKENKNLSAVSSCINLFAVSFDSRCLHEGFSTLVAVTFSRADGMTKATQSTTEPVRSNLIKAICAKQLKKFPSRRRLGMYVCAITERLERN